MKVTKEELEFLNREYGVSSQKQWDRSCRKMEKYQGVTAVCLLAKKHTVCIYTVPKSYQEPKKSYLEESTVAKKMPKTDAKPTTVAKTEKTEPKKRGNAEALAKAREAGAEARAEQHSKKITLLVKDNPKRPGSKAHGRYAMYRTGMTVGEFLTKGGSSADIAYDLKHSYIAVK